MTRDIAEIPAYDPDYTPEEGKCSCCVTLMITFILDAFIIVTIVILLSSF